MKIERITLQDFKCFEDMNIRFTKPVNLIFGENASGKTTIAQAIALALTGRVNGQNGGGSDRRPLVRHDAAEFAVSVSLSQNGVPGRLEHYDLTQYASAKESTDPEALFQGLKTNRETLGALLETTGFLSLHPDEKKRILFELLPDLKVDGSNMARHLAAWLKARPEMFAKHDITPAEDLLGMLASPATLEEAYDQAYEERRIARRELKIMGDSPRLPRGLTREQLETSLNGKREELSSLHVAIGETKGMAEGERRQIERELATIAQELERLETLLRDADPEEIETRLDDLEKERLAVGKEIQSLKEDYAALQRETGKLLARQEQEEKNREKAKTFTGHCPVFPEVICKTKAVTARITAVVADQNGNDAAIEAQTKKTNDVVRLFREKEETLNQMNGGIAAAKNTLARLTEAQRKEGDLREKRRELNAVLAAVGEDKAAETERLKERIVLLQGQIREESELLAALEKAERIRALEVRANKLEVLTQAFSPKGIMSELMQSAAASLMTLANGLMGELTVNRYALEIDFEEGFRIFLCDYEKSCRTEVNLISASERFRVGIVLQAVLSELVGLRFMVIDGIDVLDQTNRGFFFQFLRKALSRFDQIIGFCTTGQQAPKNPGLPEVDFFLLADRQLRQIAA
ncbi:MAG TPA: AAA family ATPase [Syntrophales bacterium]|nr:AAA family ATPase [Syntrophales bacterium]